MTQNSQLKLYYAVGLLIVFLNNLFLPHGLLYSTILSPVFFYWLIKENKLKQMLLWSLLFLIPIPFHLAKQINLNFYLISTFGIVTLWIFIFSIAHGLTKIGSNLSEFYKSALILNSIIVFFALLALPFNSTRNIFWNELPFSPGLAPFPRLQAFAYEPSHYALLLSPISIFFILKTLITRNSAPILTSLAVIIPLLASLSFGATGGLMVSILIGLCAYAPVLPKATKRFAITAGILAGFVLLGLVAFWPDNPIFFRINNLILGNDTSGKGRIWDSFYFATELLKSHGSLFGIGPGQIKLLAHDLIMDHYKYWYSSLYASATMRIPNSMAEILATYGIYGFALKLGIQTWLFYRTRVYLNLYSLILFIFIFIYQFTGSFMTSTGELAIWAIVFITRFPEFEFKTLAEPKQGPQLETPCPA